MLEKIGAFALIALAWCASASADGIQAQCGNEAGKAFAVPQGLVRPENSGWYDDTTRGETVIRIDTNTGEVDVRFKDATRVWQSVEDQGGSSRLFSAQSDPAQFMVVVAYPGTTVEVLTLAKIDGSSATLMHTVSRSMPAITNARIMVAACVLSSY